MNGLLQVTIDTLTSACGTDGASPADPSASNDGAGSHATAALIQVDHQQANQTEVCSSLIAYSSTPLLSGHLS